ncbi:methyl-accepting chemotaxis protein [Shouchella sp. 1P09AA]|uniref:methyl-accepting chemotaxis protein n=1 Tax=unclassified Shouchella TaxID=2893065 RepID=UPI0039A0C8A7
MFTRFLQNIQFMKLRTKLFIAFTAILVIPSALIGLISYQNAKEAILDEMTSATEESLAIVDETLTLFIEAQVENIEYIASASDLADFNEEEPGNQRFLLDSLQATKNHVEQTYVGMETGDFINAPSSFQNPPDYDPRERPWYQRAMEQAGEIIITSPYISQSSEQPVTTIARTTDDGLGVAALNLELTVISDLLSSITIGETGYVFLLDENNAYVSHPYEEPGVEADESFLSFTDVNEGFLSYSSNGDDQLLTFQSNDVTGWTIAASMYEEEMNEAVMPILTSALTVLTIAILIGMIIIYFLVTSINTPIQRLIHASERMAEGNLSIPYVVNARQTDEIGRLGRSFEKMRASLVLMITNIQAKSTDLSQSAYTLTSITNENMSATEQITEAVQEVANGVEKQSVSVRQSEQVASAMSSDVNHVVKKTNHIHKTTDHAALTVHKGNEAITTAIEQMTQIKDTVKQLSLHIDTLGNRSKEIEEVTETIKGIATQTNLLALNAAIEAARAGEHGRGFSIVADEVRKLSDMTAASTETISELVQSVQQDTKRTIEQMDQSTNQVNKGIEVVQTAGQSFGEIQTFVQDVAIEVNESAKNVASLGQDSQAFVTTFQDLSSISEQASASMQNISASTEEQLASMEEIAASVEQLGEVANNLKQLTSQFHVEEQK